MAESWKKLKTSNVLFIVCLNPNRSALVRDLLSYNSLFVGQLYEDISLALHARDLIIFTTDLQTLNYYSTNHCQKKSNRKAMNRNWSNKKANPTLKTKTGNK